MKWLSLLMKFEKYLPKWLRDKLVAYFLKKKVKDVFGFKQDPKELVNHDSLSCTTFAENLGTPEFLDAMEKVTEHRKKILGIDKRK